METKKLSFAEMQGLLEKAETQNRWHGLIIGDKGVGKTSLLKTAPRPIVVASFDPGGLLALSRDDAVGPAIPEDQIMVINCENDDYLDPKAYLYFERQFKELRKNDIFPHIGTFALSSITTFAQSLMWQIMKKENRIIAGMDRASDQKKQGMQMADWGTLNTMFQWWSRAISALPCHTIMEGHIARNYDEVQMTHVKTLMLPGASKDNVPNIVPEVYYMSVDNKGNRQLLTNYTKGFKASTKFGAGCLADEEPADFRGILQKCGLPHEDVV